MAFTESVKTIGTREGHVVRMKLDVTYQNVPHEGEQHRNRDMITPFILVRGVE